MCGIIAVCRRPSRRPPPAADEVLAAARAVAVDGLTPGRDDLAKELSTVVNQLGAIDDLLCGVPGVQCLVDSAGLGAALTAILDDVDAAIATVEAELDDTAGAAEPEHLEALNASLLAAKDASWAIRADRIGCAEAVAALAGPHAGSAALAGYTSVQLALSALDRLEVRGRDSAGLQLTVTGHGLDPDDETVATLLAERGSDPLFTTGAVRLADGALCLPYKAAAEIGELGDNTAALRAAITDDALLRRALANDGAELTVLGHTRWASVGIISEPNAHPLNADEWPAGEQPADLVDDGHRRADEPAPPYVAAVLNGDVDNFADLKTAEGLRIADEITTDAKVIPTLASRRLARGESLDAAFRHTVQALDGSVAITANATAAPGDLLLALRGSGQALYVGLAEDAYLVASEPYGVVELCDRYLRMDGETPANPADPAGSRGQVIRLSAADAGELVGIARTSYDGTALPVTEADLATAEITTRDIDRGDARHFLLKEITEAPASFRKTLRGKIIDGPGGPRVTLGEDTLPRAIAGDLTAGRITRILAIGQGTAAIAAQALPHALGPAADAAGLRVEAQLATELSGFGLTADMAGTLVVAVSQSGTTTDTNRTVDLARSRGARVISIVNRRASDLVERSDGVLYTSDGRDVEMSVASTKAFYSQVAAAFLLAGAIVENLDGGNADKEWPEVLAALRDLPAAMETTLGRRPAIAQAAKRFAPHKRYWAVVGSGGDRIAARELRIKLSELCYKSIACDATEDKKHIDLSSEPLILVCAGGLFGGTADDVAKEVAIYRAHKATAIVVAAEGETRYDAAQAVIEVPVLHSRVAFVLATMVGHLFGYEAALAIDALANPLRQARSAIEAALSRPGAASDGDRLLAEVRDDFAVPAAEFNAGLTEGRYDGTLEAATAVRLAGVLRYAVGTTPLETYEAEFGRIGTPGGLIEDLTVTLTGAIDELTRPVDAIKHQAKTVTVGISRADEGVLMVPLVAAALERGAPRDRLSYRALRTLAGLDRAVEEVVGYTRYQIEGDVEAHQARIWVIDRGGISLDLPLRTEKNPVLRGTKHRAATEREVTVAVGRSDGRSVILIPEVKANQCVGMTLLHARFADRLPAPVARSVLEQYRTRYSALSDAVTETEPALRDDLLGEISILELLTAPVHVLAENWTGRRR